MHSRTDSDSVNLGSNPSSPATEILTNSGLNTEGRPTSVPATPRHSRTGRRSRRTKVGTSKFADVPPARKGETHIYLIDMGGFAYKIGRGDAKGRLRDLQVGSPFHLELVAAVPVPERYAPDVETTLHEQFAATRLRGEWFGMPAGFTRTKFAAVVTETAPLYALCFEYGAHSPAAFKRLAQPVPALF